MSYYFFMKKLIFKFGLVLLAFSLASCGQTTQGIVGSSEGVFSVSFDCRGGSPISQQKGTVADTPHTSRDGFSFINWYDDYDESIVTFPFTPTRNTTLHAKWHSPKADLLSNFIKSHGIQQNYGWLYETRTTSSTYVYITSLTAYNEGHDKQYRDSMFSIFDGYFYSPDGNYPMVEEEACFDFSFDQQLEDKGTGFNAYHLSSNTQYLETIGISGFSFNSDNTISLPTNAEKLGSNFPSSYDSTLGQGESICKNCLKEAFSWYKNYSVQNSLPEIWSNGENGSTDNSSSTSAPSGQDIEGYTVALLSDGTYSIKGYNGMSANLQIPSTLSGKKVTQIEDGAFSNDYFLESVVLPTTIKRIGKACFSNCTNIKSINIPKAIQSIGQDAFAGCTQIAKSLSSPSIPSDTTWSSSGNQFIFSIDGDVQIKSTAKLTIEKGVVVIFKSGSVLNYGTLSCEGAADSPVILSNANLLTPNSNGSCVLSLTHTILLGGGFSQATGNSQSCSFSISYTNFINVNSGYYGYVWYPDKADFANCLFIKCGGLSVGFRKNENAFAFNNCTFYMCGENDRSVIDCWASYGTSTGLAVTNCNFIRSPKYSLSISLGGLISASGCYFGVDSASEVSAQIQDGNTDYSISNTIKNDNIQYNFVTSAPGYADYI